MHQLASIMSVARRRGGRGKERGARSAQFRGPGEAGKWNGGNYSELHNRDFDLNFERRSPSPAPASIHQLWPLQLRKIHWPSRSDRCH
jgi:hypothetical protein